MISVTCKITRSGKVVHEETTFYEGREVSEIAKGMEIFGEKVEMAFAFDPPLITEIPVTEDEVKEQGP